MIFTISNALPALAGSLLVKNVPMIPAFHAMYKTKMFNPKKIKVDKASLNVVRIGADITAGSFLNLIAKSGIIVPKNLAKITTNHNESELAKIINESETQSFLFGSSKASLLNTGIA
ncbi:Uncharacterised protein [Mycoplasmopsis edwardii]|uniref:Uncharacterized protein n=1 Tax=Mycoplasmopsis edwardii TaxID=53558 RepID=A0A3B0PVY7_9BACT|nr:Uncharacterised protein [Mycoplasmopsis edwardii]